MDFLTQLGGLTSEGKTIPVTFRGTRGDVNFTRPDLAITSRVTRPKPIFVEGFRFLASVASRTPKITIPSPSMLSQVGRANIDRKVYPDLDAFVEDSAAAYRAEIADLYAAAAGTCSSTTWPWRISATTRCARRRRRRVRIRTRSSGSP